MEQILLANSLPKETVTATNMPNKNTKAMFYLLKSDTEFFDIFTKGKKIDTLEPFLLIICLDYLP